MATLGYASHTQTPFPSPLPIEPSSYSLDEATLTETIPEEPELSEKSSEEPLSLIPIYRTGNTYHLFSASSILYLRTHYNIPGVLTGSLPQSPQQNVFLGLPLQLMPEEARFLVERNVCTVVDNARAHREGLRAIGRRGREEWRAMLAERGKAEGTRRIEDARRKAVGAVGALTGEKGEKARRALGLDGSATSETNTPTSTIAPTLTTETQETLFAPTPSSPSSSKPRSIHHITPTESTFLPASPPSSPAPALPPVPKSYPLYSHLNSAGYFLSPGLRFGCQYVAYPGDSLRFHSHFLVVAREWEEEFDLQMLVAGGRLGTGVKKGFLLGGETAEGGEEGEEGERTVRTFCIEWGGM